MKKRLLISTVVASLLLGSSTLFASSYMHDSVGAKESKALNNPSSVAGSNTAKEKVEETNSKESFLAKEDEFRGEFQSEVKKDELNRLKKVVNREYTKHQKSLKKAPKELLKGVEEVLAAIKALHSNKTSEAQKALNKASTLFDKGLKAAPGLDMVPVADDINVDEFTGDAKLVKNIKNEAIQLLKDNDTQEAIDILEPLQDEMVMTTKLIPIGVYPVAVKSALKDIKSKKIDNAFKTLVTALNTTVTQTTVVPIPLVTAQDLVIEASQLDKSHKKETLALLNRAQDELNKAIYLGYTKKHESSYKSIDKEIENLKTKAKGKNIFVKSYDHVLKSFESLVHKHTSDVKQTKH
jgi:hypothetical protein